MGGLCLYFVAVSRRDRRILQAESDRRRQENETQRVRLQLQGETISRQQTELRLERMRSKLGESRQLLLRHLEVQRHISELKRAGEQEDDLDGQQVARLIDRFSLTPNSWPELARIIDQIYDDLPVGLSEVYPQLSVDDVRLCCMIIVGLSSSEIAQVLDIRTESVYRKRRRLKKKLSLGEKDSLREHLLPRFVCVRSRSTTVRTVTGTMWGRPDMGFMDCPFSRPAGRGESLVEMADVSVGSFRPGNLRQALRR